MQGSGTPSLDLLLTRGRELAATPLPRETAIVTYCAGPACPQSRQAAEKLLALGFTNVRAFEGGLEAWKAAGRAVEVVADAKVA